MDTLAYCFLSLVAGGVIALALAERISTAQKSRAAKSRYRDMQERALRECQSDIAEFRRKIAKLEYMAKAREAADKQPADLCDFR